MYKYETHKNQLQLFYHDKVHIHTSKSFWKANTLNMNIVLLYIYFFLVFQPIKENNVNISLLETTAKQTTNITHTHNNTAN